MTQVHANDLVILISGKHPGNISKLKQKSTKMVQQCNVKLNPTKTALEPFIKKRSLKALTPPIFYQQHLKNVQDVKKLGVIQILV